MKRNNINCVLRKKFDEFLGSIEDLSVRELVATNSFISGGCIVSLLLGEKVNDFDIYFTNKKTVLAVAEYYVDKFKDKLVDKNNEPLPFIKVFDKKPGNLQEGGVKIHINGASVASLNGSINFLNSIDDPHAIIGYMENLFSYKKEEEVQEASTYLPVFITDNAISLSGKIQLVLRFYGEPEEVLKNFDYVHCTNYWKPVVYDRVSSSGRNNPDILELRPEALEAILTKDLRYIGSKYPICSLLRMRKFIDRGWTISAGQVLKMAFQIKDLNLYDVLTLKEQLIGVDSVYFLELLSLIEKELKENPLREDFSLDYSLLANLIDNLF